MALGMYNKNVISKKVKHNIKTEYVISKASKLQL